MSRRVRGPRMTWLSSEAFFLSKTKKNRYIICENKTLTFNRSVWENSNLYCDYIILYFIIFLLKTKWFVFEFLHNLTKTNKTSSWITIISKHLNTFYKSISDLFLKVTINNAYMLTNLTCSHCPSPFNIINHNLAVFIVMLNNIYCLYI